MKKRKTLAEDIADSLFTNVHGNCVQRLVLTNNDPPRDFGGWSHECAVSAIEGAIHKHAEMLLQLAAKNQRAQRHE